MDNKKILRRISFFYLALGSITLYVSISYIGFIVYYYLPHNVSSSSKTGITYVINIMGYWSTFVIMFMAGTLLVLSCYGFVNSKKYARFTGLLGCGTLTLTFLYSVYNFGIKWVEYFNFAPPIYIATKVGQASLGIASIVLLFLTLFFWKKLA